MSSTFKIKSRKYGSRLVIIDDEDFDKIKQYTWSLLYDKTIDGFYISTHIYKNGKRTTLSIHRLIMNPPSGYQVDHIDHNTLDNRKENLRICTNQQNCQNRRISKTNKSGAIGVFWNKKSCKWISAIKVSGKQIYLGSFVNKTDAIHARMLGESKYFLPK